jgi:hypothetical protein
VYCVSSMEEEGARKSYRNGRHQECIKPISASNGRGNIRAYTFLHVPIPTVLKSSISSSLLTSLTNFQIENLLI